MKRLFDAVCAAGALVMTSPLIAAAAIAIKLDSPGPAFYRRLRVGKDGVPFQIVKLRTMVAGTHGSRITAAGDSRITRVGHILRRTKLDELPQLLNVLNGEMSLVGPRPEDPHYVALYTPEQRRVLGVRPGITGLATIAFVHEEEILRGAQSDDAYITQVMPAKLALDMRYVEHATLLGDLRILAATVFRVMRRATRHSAGPRP